VDEYGWGKFGLNAFRLANKRCKRVVESCTTRLKNLHGLPPESMPIDIMQRCRRIEEISCRSPNLRSLEGCPNGLKKLYIRPAPNLSDLSPLASCSMMESLVIDDSSITDISVVASMPLLEVFLCMRHAARPSIKDLSPLSSCPRLKHLSLWGNRELKDLTPLSACTALEYLCIRSCPLITSLAPLSTLQKLKSLYCLRIGPQTSLLPLASCFGLEVLTCHNNVVDLDELKKRKPSMAIRVHNY
jgi:Leucine-rich repeat (LRR) protein